MLQIWPIEINSNEREFFLDLQLNMAGMNDKRK